MTSAWVKHSPRCRRADVPVTSRASQPGSEPVHPLVSAASSTRCQLALSRTRPNVAMATDTSGKDPHNAWRPQGGAAAGVAALGGGHAAAHSAPWVWI